MNKQDTAALTAQVATLTEQVAALLDFQRRYDEGKQPAEDARQKAEAKAAREATNRAREAERREAAREAARAATRAHVDALVEQVRRGYSEAERHAAFDREVNRLIPGTDYVQPAAAWRDVHDFPDWQPQRSTIGTIRAQRKGEPFPATTMLAQKAIAFDHDGVLVLAVPYDNPHVAATATTGRVEGVKAGDKPDDFILDLMEAYVAGNVTGEVPQRTAKRVLWARH